MHFIFALGSLLVAGCIDTSQPLAPLDVAPAHAVVDNGWQTRTFVFRKLSTCRDEDIAIEARRHEIFAVTEDEAGGFHVVWRFSFLLTGTGLTSGAQYVGSEQGTIVFNTTNPYPHAESVVVNTRLIGKGGAGDYMFSTRGHITINANGDATSDFLEFDMVCR